MQNVSKKNFLIKYNLLHERNFLNISSFKIVCIMVNIKLEQDWTITFIVIQQVTAQPIVKSAYSYMHDIEIESISCALEPDFAFFAC